MGRTLVGHRVASTTATSTSPAARSTPATSSARDDARRLVRSPVAHARIRGIDASAARAMPRVWRSSPAPRRRARRAGALQRRPDPGRRSPRRGTVLAVDRVRYVGEPVAAVVAETQADALAAALAVRSTSSPCRSCSTPTKRWRTSAAPLRGVGDEPDRRRRVRLAEEFDAAIAAADHVLEGVIRSHRGNAAPMETARTSPTGTRPPTG